ncbi:MAG TPA: hypothetical protein VG498_22890, partial [Terriglobales bacterium]|nr:hypothetical protein [Terriglobales bacterium]
PALVAWVGSSGAGIGWFPLGYGEPYIPYYHVSRNYFETVNVSNTRITNITYVTNNYYNVNDVRITNIHYVHQTTGITIVNHDVLVNSHRVDHDVFIDRDHDRDWHDHHNLWVTAGPPVAPSHRAVLGVVDYHRAQQPPDRVLNRRVVENIKPPERPVRFDDKHDELEAHHGRPLDSDEEDRMRRRIPDQQRPGHPEDKDTRANNDRGRSWQHGEDRHDDRDRRDSNGDDRLNPSPDGHGRHGDNDQQNARGGNNGDWRGYRDGKGNDNRDGRSDSSYDSRNNNNEANSQRSGDWYSRRQFPRPPRSGDDDHGQQSAGGMNSSDPRQRNQNPNGNDDKGQHADSGNWRNDGPNSNDQRSDDSYAGRQFPRPSHRGNDDQGLQSAGGMNNTDPRQRTQNPGGDDRAQRSGQYGNGSSGAQAPDNSNAARTFPRPPRVDTDRVRTFPSQQDGSSNPDGGRSASVPNEQAGSGMRGRGPDRAERPMPPNYGVNSSGSSPSQPAVHEAAHEPSGDLNVPRLPAPAQPGDSRRDSPSSDRQMNRPSYSDHGSSTPPPQQAERSQPRPQLDHSDARPSPPPQRAAQPQRSAPPESHGSPSKDSGSNGNSHGASGFQDRDHGKVQDR